MSFRDIHFSWLEEIIIPAIDLVDSTPKDRDLIQRDANERTIVANIYCKANSILHQKQSKNNELDHLSIDLEYNRNYVDSKKAFEKCCSCHNNDCFIMQEGFHTEKIYPDMLIHQRGLNMNNQVAIEFKKASNQDKEERNADKAKLIYLTCQQPFPQNEDKNYKFHFGFFIDLDIDTYSVTTYQDANYKVQRIRQGGVWL